MPKTYLTILALAFGLVAPLAHAEERLSFVAPETFNLASQSSDTAQKSYLPQGETFDEWSAMITLTQSTRTAGQPAEALVGVAARAAIEACPGAGLKQGPVGMQNGFETAIVFTQCKTETETEDGLTMVKVLSGSEASHTIHYIWRAQPPQQEILQAAVWIRNQFLCDSNRADAPCPDE